MPAASTLACPSYVSVPVAPVYLPDPPVIVRVTYNVKSLELTGLGVSVTAPVAVNRYLRVVTKTSSDVALSPSGLELVMTAVLAPFSTPSTLAKDLPRGSFGAGIWVSVIRPETFWQSARALTAVPSTAKHSASATLVFLFIRSFIRFSFRLDRFGLPVPIRLTCHE
jgi:hypothetical protein